MGQVRLPSCESNYLVEDCSGQGVAKSVQGRPGCDGIATAQSTSLQRAVDWFPAKELLGMGDVPELARVVRDAVDDREWHVHCLDAGGDQPGAIPPAQP